MEKDFVERINRSILDSSTILQNSASFDASIVQQLHLRKEQISLKQIDFSPNKWISLKLLNVNRNLIGNKGCKYLSKAHLPTITRVNLGRNQIGSEGVLHISKAKWTTIEKLFLAGNKISFNSGKWLAKSNFKNIAQINLCDNNLTAEQIISLMLLTYSPQKLSFDYCDLIEAVDIVRIRSFIKQKNKCLE